MSEDRSKGRYPSRVKGWLVGHGRQDMKVLLDAHGSSLSVFDSRTPKIRKRHPVCECYLPEALDVDNSVPWVGSNRPRMRVLVRT